MKSTAYMKGVLLLIALFLGIIACRPSFQSESALAQTAAKLNIQVLCESCRMPADETTSYMIILDQTTGKVWAYKRLDVNAGKVWTLNEAAVYLGTMNEVGKPLSK